MPETCRVSVQNKFEKLVHLVAFIIRKFVTMHGHMNVKLSYRVWTQSLVVQHTVVPHAVVQHAVAQICLTVYRALNEAHVFGYSLTLRDNLFVPSVMVNIWTA
jgi:hypothetical protein